jgi:class 3 adenylate cyclase
MRRLLTDDGSSAFDDLGLTAEHAAIGVQGTGIERPVPEWVDLNQTLYRVFAFIDVCGFTAYTDRNGAHAAIDVLTRFRAAVRDVTARRGTRVAKWLGDGVLLVGTEAGPIIATSAELLLRSYDDDYAVHGGLAAGSVLLFEGDDYIGRPVNLAARLGDAAAPGELLASGLDDDVPDWVEIAGSVTVRAGGIGDVPKVSQLKVSRDAYATVRPAAHHPTLSVIEGEGR